MYSVYEGKTTRWISQNIVKNQIANIPFHWALIQSIRLTALVINADQTAKAIYKAHWGNTIGFHHKTNSKSCIQLIYNAKQEF